MSTTNNNNPEDAAVVMKKKPMSWFCSCSALVVYVAIFFAATVAIILSVRNQPAVYRQGSSFREIEVLDGASVNFSYGETWVITNWNEDDCSIEQVGLQQTLRIRPVVGTTDGCKDVEISIIAGTVQVSRFVASSKASIKVNGFEGGSADAPSVPQNLIGDIRVTVSSSGSVTFQGGVINKIEGSVDGEDSKVIYVANANTTDVKSVINCKSIETTNGGTLEGFEDVSNDCSTFE